MRRVNPKPGDYAICNKTLPYSSIPIKKGDKVFIRQRRYSDTVQSYLVNISLQDDTVTTSVWLNSRHFDLPMKSKLWKKQ